MRKAACRQARALLARLTRPSIYGALMLVLIGGLALPALVGGYLLIGVQAQESARGALLDALRRNADILALGMQASLWNRNADSARSLADAVMGDPAVLHIRVSGQSGAAFLDLGARRTARGALYRSERDIVVRGERIGRILIEMDDARSLQELRAKQSNYGLVLAGQLAISLLLIILFLRRRLLRPLRTLMAFSDRLSRGEFDTPLALPGQDELGRLGSQMERMRVAIKQLFEDSGQREERFRTIVTQMPGAVFRVRSNGQIEFVSDAIEGISGYPACDLMAASADTWENLICPQDRRRQRRVVRDAVNAGRPYQIEYRIDDAGGVERWVSEHGQPQFDASGAHWVDGILSDISARKHSEMRIAALLAEQNAILDNVLFGVMFVRHRHVVSANRSCEVMFGYASGQLVGASTALIYPSPAAYAAAGVVHYAALADGQYVTEEFQYQRSDGSVFWCLVSGYALDCTRPDEGSIWVFADITERTLAEQKLRQSATVLEHIADGVMVIDSSGHIVATNPAFTLITGYSEAEALQQDARATRSSHNDAAFMQRLREEMHASGVWRGELRHVRKNGEPYLEWLTISAVRDKAGLISHYVAVFRDITKARESQDKLDHLAHHDALTALPNRQLFHDRLQHALRRAVRDQQQLAILFIDLDRFKHVNDTLGHHVGDELLQQVAGALAARLRDGDTLARLGGDEFIVLLEQVDGQFGAGQVADKLIAMFEQPFIVAGYELFVSCSIGISLYPADGLDLNLLIRNADVAMYQAKARGRNGYQFYAPSMSGDGVERLRLEALLRRSIDKREMFLEYQAQLDIDSGCLIGVEALVRWQSPELGLVAPARFIPLAEDTGFIHQLGQWVLQEACRQMVRWQQDGLVVPKIAVNLSVKQFERGSIVAMVAAILSEAGLAPARLQLEVTESLIMNTGDALGFINDLHAIGVGLAIDDFGTGYSSLAYLKRLPVQTLKIDRSFIQDIASDSDDEAITIAIIQLGKSLNLSVIAEGVETAAQAAFLLRHGCHLAQGYFYGRPQRAPALLERWRTRAA